MRQFVTVRTLKSIGENMEAIEKRTPEVEDLRKHTPEQTAELQTLLDAGVVARADLRRPDFYEVDGAEDIYYVFRYPSGHKVLLIAAWKKGPPTKGDGMKAWRQR
jgi:hypothetical protein